MRGYRHQDRARFIRVRGGLPWALAAWWFSSGCCAWEPARPIRSRWKWAGYCRCAEAVPRWFSSIPPGARRCPSRSHWRLGMRSRSSSRARCSTERVCRRTRSRIPRARPPRRGGDLSDRSVMGTKERKQRAASHGAGRGSAAGDRIIGRLRRICMALPDANEKLSHGEPTWFAGKGKVFAMLDNHHHGATHLAVWLPQPFGAQEALIGSDPERFFRPPYVGVSGWVGVVLDTGPDWDAVAALAREAYLTVATPKLRKLAVGAVEGKPQARSSSRRRA